MEELKYLHEQVKNHPYRINEDSNHLKSYKSLLFRLSDAFYKALNDSKFKSARNMIHDFNRDINNLGRDWKFSSESNLHVENCISVIHNFIDTDEVLYWYDGVGDLFHSVGRYVKYSWDDKNNKYHPDVPKEKIPQLLVDLSKHVDNINDAIKRNPNSISYNKDIVKYWNDTVEYLKTQL